MVQATGGCLCGALRFMATGAPCRVRLCHCMDCRKHHGALFHASAIFPDSAVTITGDFRTYGDRSFCPTCELWTIRREGWLPEFAGMQHYDKDRSEG